MTERLMAKSCRGRMWRQETNDDGRLIDGMTKRAGYVMMTSDVRLTVVTKSTRSVLCQMSGIIPTEQ